MTTLQRRLLFFLVSGLALFALLWALDWSWKGLIVLLVVLLVFLGAYIKPIYTLVVHPPQHTPTRSEEEYPSYQEGYHAAPSDGPSVPVSYYPSEQSQSQDAPEAQYPEQVQ